jgi:two-component system response regulator CssR
MAMYGGNRMGYRIYLVEDEAKLNEILTSYMEKEGWEVFSFLTGEAAIGQIDEAPDLWVLDIMLPDIDGIQLLKAIREKNSDIPVIFISARNSDMDKIMGLELGSDDYLAKPFLPRELIIRIQKILNRIQSKSNLGQTEAAWIDGYQVDSIARRALENGREISLTSKEFDMLLMLVREKGKALSRQEILDAIWGADEFYSDRVVDNLIKRLRKKLPNLRIETIYGFGYRRL